MSRVCLSCKSPMVKRSYENERRFAKRMFDSRECAKAYMKKHRVGFFADFGDQKYRKFIS